MAEGVTTQMADTAKKTAAKKAPAKKADPIEELRKAIEAARKAGLVVKAIATCNTDTEGTTVRF